MRWTFWWMMVLAPGVSAQGIEQFVPPAPTPTSFIADPAKVLSDPAHASLDARIRAVQDSGYGDIGVAILPSIGDYTPSQVGTAIYRAWKIGRVAAIGSARRNLGVLILIVPKELAPDQRGECWIQTGTGAEGTVTDAASGTICRTRMIPHLQMRDYPAALAAGIEAISDRLHSDPTLGQPDPSMPSRRGPFRWWQVPAALLLAIAGFFGRRSWQRYRPHRCPRCGKAMRRLEESRDNDALDQGQQLEEKLGSVDYDVWQCSCSQLLVVPYRKVMSGYHECPACHYRTEKTTRHVITAASSVSSGVAEDIHLCLQCHAERRERVVLPMISSDSSSSGSSGGGGGGGSSFGGSGSTSGGGGGSSY